MADEWFYSRNGQQMGPVTLDTLIRMAASRELRPTDMVWRSGLADWAPASAIPEIFAVPLAPMPVPYAQPFPTPTTSSDAHAMMRFEANKKSLFVAYLLWWFLGGFGAHRFYLGKTGSAVAILVITLVSIPLMFVGIGFLTICVSGIWAFIDAFLIPGICREFNNGLVNSLAWAGAPSRML